MAIIKGKERTFPMHQSKIIICLFVALFSTTHHPVCKALHQDQNLNLTGNEKRQFYDGHKKWQYKEEGSMIIIIYYKISQ